MPVPLRDRRTNTGTECSILCESPDRDERETAGVDLLKNRYEESRGWFGE